MKRPSQNFLYFALLLLPITSLSTAHASMGCTNEEVQGVMLKSSYSMPPIDDPDSLIVFDINSKVTSYFIPGHSYTEQDIISKTTINLGPVHKAETFQTQTWHTPDKAYTYTKGKGRPSVRRMQRRSFNTTPISLLTSTSDTRIFLDRECSWASQNVPGLGEMKSCTLAIYGWPHQIFSEMGKTKAKETPILLIETCIPKSKFNIPELNWQ